MASLIDQFIPPSFIMSMMSMLINHWFFELGEQRSTKVVHHSYDFVVIGGGTAGAVVASRLSENPAIKVLLLERGGSGNEMSDIPWLSRLTLHSNMTHRIYTPPQKYACRGDQPCETMVALVLGGGSTHNEMGFLRGNRKDFDDWANKEGAPGWSYKDVLPYFKKLEHAEPGLGSDRYRGRSGPVYVKSNIGKKYLFDSFTRRWMAAARENGYPIGDYNGERQTVFSPMQVNVDRAGRRVSSDNAYLKPHANRTNLHILMFAHVTRIILKGNKAIGVEYTRRGQTHRVFADKEVILSAGALMTPRILMHSGIGPRDQLEKFKIPVRVKAEGVGRNFQDHPSLNINFTMSMKSEHVATVQNYIAWRFSGHIFGSTLVCGVGVLNTSLSVDPFDARARTWFHILPNDTTTEVYGFSLWNTVWKPTSIGRVTLRSKDPEDYPVVDPNYMSSWQDRQNMYESLQATMKMMRSRPFREIDAKPYAPIVKRCVKYGLWTDQYLKCIADTESQTEWHYCCTAKMGQKSDPLAVTDERLRVRGVRSLRVVDASVMPTVTRANTNAACFMIGEKGADIIKQDWKLR